MTRVAGRGHHVRRSGGDDRSRRHRDAMGCVFEDFLGQDWDDGQNFIDVYLNRWGWKEGLRNSAYMRALKALVMSLYKPPISNPVRA